MRKRIRRIRPLSLLLSLGIIATTSGCSAAGQGAITTGNVSGFIVDFIRQAVAAFLF
ncbi:MAG: hypothetical protein HY287_03650 [Planctomycetes bacterium]|nr:hypothetical protein [Planctomycetota bacterium]MBI3833406.1 hypothetical protein [Planctomycetota bacterium]